MAGVALDGLYSPSPPNPFHDPTIDPPQTSTQGPEPLSEGSARRFSGSLSPEHSCPLLQQGLAVLVLDLQQHVEELVHREAVALQSGRGGDEGTTGQLGIAV